MILTNLDDKKIKINVKKKSQKHERRGGGEHFTLNPHNILYNYIIKVHQPTTKEITFKSDELINYPLRLC